MEGNGKVLLPFSYILLHTSNNELYEFSTQFYSTDTPGPITIVELNL